MTKESLIKDLLVLGNLYNTNEEIEKAVYKRALSIFNLYESEVEILNIQRVAKQRELSKAFAEMVAKDNFAYLKDASELLKDFESL